MLLRLSLFLLVVLLIAGIIFRMRTPIDNTKHEQAETELAQHDESETGTGAGIIGTAKCLECHAEKSAPYASSGHSKTLHRVEELPFADRLDGIVAKDPKRNVEFHYSVDDSGVSVQIPKLFGERRFPLDYGFGSGQHAVTFLTLIPEPGGDTVGVEHRMSWFHHKDGLGETPQPARLTPTVDAEYFGRIVRDNQLTDCIGCHTTSYRIEGDRLTNLRPNVGCENCHGPGVQHQQAVENGESELHIRFSGSGHAASYEIGICSKCHRSPTIVPDDQLTADNEVLVRFQPIGLTQSACFLNSNDSLMCSTCHDPHEHVSRRPTSQHIATCRSCHSAQHPQQTPCPISPQDDCIDCHMPSIEVFPGIFFHDHWIRVRGPADTDKGKETSGTAATHP